MSDLRIAIEAHPLLDLAVFETHFDRPLGELASPSELTSLLSDSITSAPMAADDGVRAAIRDVLRYGGFKPTGRSKPASEYLRRAARERVLGSINLAVDAGNVVSLHSGLPISVVDLDRVQLPLKVAIAPAATNYVFNTAGQTIDVGGLLCLFDADGACASPVRDSQRSKTTVSTRRTLSLIWGTIDLPGRTTRTAQWYRALLHAQSAVTTEWRICRQSAG